MQKSPRLVEVEQYGTQGWKPKYKDQCIYKGEVPCETSDSMCGGFHSKLEIEEKDWVICLEEAPKD